MENKQPMGNVALIYDFSLDLPEAVQDAIIEADYEDWEYVLIPVDLKSSDATGYLGATELQQSEELVEMERGAKTAALKERDDLAADVVRLQTEVGTKNSEIENHLAEIDALTGDAKRADQIAGVVSVMVQGFDLLREITTGKPVVEQVDVTAVTDEVCRRIGVPESFIGSEALNGRK